MKSSALYVLSCYITCIAHTFHINGIQNKTHGRAPLINSHSHRHLIPPLHLQPWIYLSAREYIFLFHAQCVYRYNKEKFVRKKSSNSTHAFRSTQLNLDSSSLNKPEKSKLPCHVRCHVICSKDLIWWMQFQKIVIQNIKAAKAILYWKSKHGRYQEKLWQKYAFMILILVSSIFTILFKIWRHKLHNVTLQWWMKLTSTHYIIHWHKDMIGLKDQFIFIYE